MSKTKEELDALKEEVNKVNEKICELTPEELEQVTGGAKLGPAHISARDKASGFKSVVVEQ